MPEGLPGVIAFVLCYLACALFALAQPPHWRAVTQAASPACAPRRARGPAAALLAVALAWLLLTEGAGFGVPLWVMLGSAAALALSLTLSWRPGWLRPLARLLDTALR